METIINIYNENYRLEASNRYNVNREQPVLEIFEADSGMPCGVISTSIKGAKLNERETIIKPIDNQDIVKTLVDAGIAVDTGKLVKSGYACYPVIELTQEFISSF